MYRRLAAAVVALGLWGAGAVIAPAATADPGTAATFTAGGSATRFNGAAFDTCTAPALDQMTAWRASSYRAVGVYIGGVNRTCAQPNLTPEWAAAVTTLGWRMLPIYMGLQPSCSDRARSAKISPAQATSQGAVSATDAITQATTLGMQPGSIVYLDVEHYDATNDGCRTAVLTYVSGFTREMHRLGYLAGVYANLSSGARQLSDAYASTGYARPDAVWVARWDGSRTLTGLTGIPDQQWSRYQRAKQYRGPHFETHDGVKLHIDSNWVNAPVATMLRSYKVIRPATARRGPAMAASVAGKQVTGSYVKVVCQTAGSWTDGTGIWNKLDNGSYISDFRLGTPTNSAQSSPIPPCFYAQQTVSADGLSVRTGPSPSFTRTSTLNNGALAWITCQVPGTAVGSTKVWDRLDLGLYVTDYYVTTRSRVTYSPPIPRCEP